MRYFIGYIVAIALLIALILFLVIGGGGKHKTPITIKPLNSYASTDAEVRLTIDGPINAGQSHEQVQITVSALEATYQQLQGYDGTVVNTQTFTNTQNSYYAFLSALMQVNFTKGNSSAALNNDTGLCPLGDRYDFSLIQNGQRLQHYWATTCGGLSTYKGNVAVTLDLFQAQIPHYDILTENIQF